MKRETLGGAAAGWLKDMALMVLQVTGLGLGVLLAFGFACVLIRGGAEIMHSVLP